MVDSRQKWHSWPSLKPVTSVCVGFNFAQGWAFGTYGELACFWLGDKVEGIFDRLIHYLVDSKNSLVIAVIHH